jgi:hypothetical protein
MRTRVRANAGPLGKTQAETAAEKQFLLSAVCIFKNKKGFGKINAAVCTSCYKHSNETKYTVFLTCRRYDFVHSGVQDVTEYDSARRVAVCSQSLIRMSLKLVSFLLII